MRHLSLALLLCLCSSGDAGLHTGSSRLGRGGGFSESATETLFQFSPGDSLAGATFTRAGEAGYRDAAGVLQAAAAGTVRTSHYKRDASSGAYVRTLAIESAAVNQHLNPTDLTVYPPTAGTVTRTANYGTAPDGTTTTTRFQVDGSNRVLRYSSANNGVDAISTQYCVSVFYRGAGAAVISIGARNGSAVNPTYLPFTGTWKRCYAAITSGTLTGFLDLTVAASADFELWGIQVEKGATLPSTYIPPPVNLATFTDQFDNAAWSKTGTTITADATTGPDGLTTADRLVDATGNSQHFLGEPFTASAATYTYSIYVKAGERTFAQVYFSNNGVDSGISVNLSTGAAGTATGTLDSAATITSAANGWYRVALTKTLTAASSVIIVSASDIDAAIRRTYVGDTTKGIFVANAQLERASGATAYAANNVAFPTRAADSLNLNQTWASQATTLYQRYYSPVSQVELESVSTATNTGTAALTTDRAYLNIAAAKGTKTASYFRGMFGLDAPNSSAAAGLKYFRRAGNAGRVICFVGDSTTSNATQLFADLAAANVPAGLLEGDTILNYGENGASAQAFLADGVTHGITNVIAANADLYVICYLINDVRLGLCDQATAIARLSSIVTQIRAARPLADIILRMPNSFTSDDPGATGFVSPLGSAQAYSTIMFNAYHAFDGLYPNVYVWDTQTSIFGTTVTTNALNGKMADILHPNAVGQSAVAAAFLSIATQ